MSNAPFASAHDAGIEIGKADRLTQARTAKLALAFKKANAEKREQMRGEFMLAYIMGKMDVDQATAETVLNTSRTKREKKAQQAYACGTNQFAHHIIRDTLREEKGEGDSSNSTDAVQACINYINKQKLTKRQMSKLIAALDREPHIKAVKLEAKARLTLTMWADANAPYHDRFVNKRAEAKAYDLAADKELAKDRKSTRLNSSHRT